MDHPTKLELELFATFLDQEVENRIGVPLSHLPDLVFLSDYWGPNMEDVRNAATDILELMAEEGEVPWELLEPVIDPRD